MRKKTIVSIVIFSSLVLASLACASIFLAIYAHKCNKVWNEQVDVLKKAAKNNVQEFNAVIQQIELNIAQLAQSLAASRSYANLNELLQAEIKNSPALANIGVSFAPGVYQSSPAKYTVYYAKDDHGQMTQVDVSQTSNAGMQYVSQISDKVTGSPQGVWLEPYVNPDTKDVWLVYQLPFYHQAADKTAKLAGVIAVSYNLPKLVAMHQLAKGIDFVSADTIFTDKGLVVYSNNLLLVGEKNNQASDFAKKIEQQKNKADIALISTHGLLGGEGELTLLSRLAVSSLISAFSDEKSDFYWYKIEYFKYLFLCWLFFIIAICLLVYCVLIKFPKFALWLSIVLFSVGLTALAFALITNQEDFSDIPGQKILYGPNALKKNRRYCS